MMKSSLLASLLLLTACELNEFNDPLPTPIACDPGAAGGADPIDGVSFDRNEMLCVGIEMEGGDFKKLRKQSRFGGNSDIEIFENMIGWIVSGCSEADRKLYTYFEADVEVGGISVSQVGIRKKGFLGSVLGNGRKKPSFKIKTDTYVDNQTLGDTERITLNNQNQDPTRMNTCLAYDIFAAAGYPAPLCNLANVMLNGESLGTYAHVEALKKRFLRRAFGDDTGSLYEGTFADFTDGHLAGAAVGELAHWEAKTSESDASGAPLLGVNEALRAPDSELLTALEPVVNVDRFITFWALETLIAHTDSYTGTSNNFYVYFDPGDAGRATFVPWGTDAVLSDEAIEDGDGRPGAFGAHVNGELARRLSRVPAASTLYQAELRRLLDEVWDETRILADIESYAGQVRSAESHEAYDEELATLRAWVSGRRAQVEEGLASELAVGADESTSCEGGIPGTLLDLFSRFGFAW
jgi:spore coat protein CotH